jgi:hypothetical protein
MLNCLFVLCLLVLKFMVEMARRKADDVVHKFRDLSGSITRRPRNIEELVQVKENMKSAPRTIYSSWPDIIHMRVCVRNQLVFFFQANLSCYTLVWFLSFLWAKSRSIFSISSMNFSSLLAWRCLKGNGKPRDGLIG